MRTPSARKDECPHQVQGRTNGWILTHPHDVTRRCDQDDGDDVVGSETMLPDHGAVAPSADAASGSNHCQLTGDDQAAVCVDEEILDGAKLDASLHVRMIHSRCRMRPGLCTEEILTIMFRLPGR